jgi:beta-lactamase superfamily II metal-dependent hydrolase
MVKPIGLRVRMYQVGFGDCFLLSFEYQRPQRDRHVLIDFGTTSASASEMDGVAGLIRDHSGGHLDAVVVSHRHRDHLSAFGDKDIAAVLAEKGPPALVVRSWTENPEAPATAKADSRRFLKSLNSARAFTDRLVDSVSAAAPDSIGSRVKRAAEAQVKNAKAVKQLEDWAKAGNATYVHYGQPSGLEEILAGVKVRVLGPPTIEQHKEVNGNRHDDPDEFWMLYNRNVGAVGPTRWLIDKMSRQQANSFLRIVRVLDDTLNNTSVILLFEVPAAGGTKRLLFAGDAQIENWEYALKCAPDFKDNLRALRKVDLYKVGHHGSRNATPRTLFNLWLEPGTAGREMVALMSTKPGKHGESTETAVPRKTLVEALKQRMTLYSTDELKAKEHFVELELDLTKRGGFVEV